MSNTERVAVMNGREIAAGATIISMFGGLAVVLIQALYSAVMAPAPEPLPTPAAWYVVRDNQVIESPSVIAVAESLEDGSYKLIGFPKIGKITERNILISGENVPTPEPPKPEPPKPEPPKPEPVVPVLKATAATYVYEKDATAITAGVMAGLNRLNREKKLIASLYEDDNTNGKDSVPAQYRVALEAAKKAGLPALIITNGDTVLNVVKAPVTEQQVWEAVQ